MFTLQPVSESAPQHTPCSNYSFALRKRCSVVPPSASAALMKPQCSLFMRRVQKSLTADMATCGHSPSTFGACVPSLEYLCRHFLCDECDMTVILYRKIHASENVCILSLVRIRTAASRVLPAPYRANRAPREYYPKVSDLFSLNKS